MNRKTKMKLLAATVMSLSLLASACTGANQARVGSGSYAPSAALDTQAQKITITRSGSQPSRQAPAQYFTGSVRIDPLFQAKDPSHTSGSYVTFEPGARSAWHTHPLGQTLIVTAGTAGCSAGVIPSRKSGREMWCGFRRVKNTGTERHRPPQ